MTITTKFEIGEKPYVIHNNRISKQFPIIGIDVVVSKSGYYITYQLLESKAATSLDNDRVIYISEPYCYTSVTELTEGL